MADSNKSIYVRVRDRKTGLEREVTKYAYQLIPKRYELLSENVDVSTIPQKKRSQDAEVAVNEMSSETHPISPAIPMNEPEGITIVRKKPGPKPKTNA